MRLPARFRRSVPPVASDESPDPQFQWLEPRAPVGTRRLVSPFFDRFPKFFDTSETSTQPWRLNLRYDAMFAENREVLEGASVLDIASHDGRWSLVEQAGATLDGYGVAGDRYDFIGGDVFEVLARGQQDVDVVLCLGFLYHTLRYNELFTRIRQCGARTLIVDTIIRPELSDPVIRIVTEPSARQGHAVQDEFSWGDDVLVGRPSFSALRLMGEAHGFTFEGWSDWGALIRDNPQARGVRDYRLGRRVTVRFRAV
jgi:hypothetical protein